MNLIHFPTVIPGTEAVYATKAEWPMPVGYIYFRSVLNDHVEILHCFVEPSLRRTGILTCMFVKLNEWYPSATFITQQGNRYSTVWLLKQGFIKRDSGWWRVRR